MSDKIIKFGLLVASLMVFSDLLKCSDSKQLIEEGCFRPISTSPPTSMLSFSESDLLTDELSCNTDDKGSLGLSEDDEQQILASLPDDLVERVSNGMATDADIQVLAGLKNLQTSSIVFDAAFGLTIDKLLQVDKKNRSIKVQLTEEDAKDLVVDCFEL